MRTKSNKRSEEFKFNIYLDLDDTFDLYRIATEYEYVDIDLFANRLFLAALHLLIDTEKGGE